MSRAISKGFMVLALASTAFSSAWAGGFSRGEANTDILFDTGRFAMSSGVLVVVPKRGFDTINGVASTDGVYADNYAVPSLAVKFSASDRFSCALTYTQPFGASSTYGTQSQIADATQDALAGRPMNAVKEAGFDTNEYGATCGLNMEAGPGRAWVLGGVFIQDINYTEVKSAGTMILEDKQMPGYRIGAAYDITEYALRGEIMYRSETKADATGTFVNSVPLGGGLVPIGTVFPANGTATLPQSVEVSLQSGVAPGWLVYGSVKWTDWSVFQSLNYTVTGIGPDTKDFFWRDGWTVQAGVGHQFTEELSGTVNLTWDRGVGTGADIMTDTWTLGGGVQMKAGPGALKFGGGLSYLTAGEQSVANGASFNATAKGDWAYAIGGSYEVNF